MNRFRIFFETENTMKLPTKFFIFTLFFGFRINRVSSQQCFIPRYRVFATADPGFFNVNGNQYTGFAVDVLTAISKTQNFTFDITVSGNSNFGTQPTTDASGDPCFPGNTGIGALQTGAYDIFIGNVIISATRARSIDFTVPLLRQNYQVGYNSYYPINGSTSTSASGYGYTTNYTPPVPVKFVTIANGASRDFLQFSTIPRIQAIWQNIQANAPTSLPATFAQAIALVKSGGGWAIFTTGPKLDQEVCQSYGILVKDPTVYAVIYAAFGVQKGSNIVDVLNQGILQLQEAGVIDYLLSKWFPCTIFNCP